MLPSVFVGGGVFIFWDCEMLQADLVFSPTQSFLQGPEIPFHWRRVYGNQDLGSRCAHCSWKLLSLLLGPLGFGNVCMYTNCVYKHLYIYISVSL